MKAKKNMNQNKAIKKVKIESLVVLSKKSTILKRGLHDSGILPKIETLIENMEKKYLDGKYAECLGLCNEILEYNKSCFTALWHKAHSLDYLDEFEEAVIWFDKALGSDDAFNLLFFRKGESLIKLKKYNEAIVCFDEYLRNCEIPNGFMNESNKTSQVRSFLVFFSIVDAFFNQAICFENIGQADKAIELYETCLELFAHTIKDYDFKSKKERYSKILVNYFKLTYETRNGANDVLNRIKKLHDSNEPEVCLILLNKLLEIEKDNQGAKIWKKRIELKKDDINKLAKDIFG